MLREDRPADLTGLTHPRRTLYRRHLVSTDFFFRLIQEIREWPADTRNRMAHRALSHHLRPTPKKPLVKKRAQSPERRRGLKCVLERARDHLGLGFQSRGGGYQAGDPKSWARHRITGQVAPPLFGHRASLDRAE